MNCDEIVRAVRVTVFVGRRDWMERQLGQSLADGVKVIPAKGTISTTTICPIQGQLAVEMEFDGRMGLDTLKEDPPEFTEVGCIDLS